MASPSCQIDQLSELVTDTYAASDHPWVLAYSGGKDSSVVLDLFLKAAEAHPTGPHIYIVSNNTRVESPLVIGHLKKMHRLIERHIERHALNISVNMTEPPLHDSFWVNLIGRGYPNPEPDVSLVHLQAQNRPDKRIYGSCPQAQAGCYCSWHSFSGKHRPQAQD